MGAAGRIIRYSFSSLLLSLMLAACAATPAPLDKPYGGLPEQFLGDWTWDKPKTCHTLTIGADGKMESICETDGEILMAERYRFDCSPDPETAFIIIEDLSTRYTSYQKLVLHKFQHDESGQVFLKIYTVGNPEKNRADRGPIMDCNKKRSFYSGPEHYYRKPH